MFLFPGSEVTVCPQWLTVNRKTLVEENSQLAFDCYASDALPVTIAELKRMAGNQSLRAELDLYVKAIGLVPGESYRTAVKRMMPTPSGCHIPIALNQFSPQLVVDENDDDRVYPAMTARLPRLIGTEVPIGPVSVSKNLDDPDICLAFVEKVEFATESNCAKHYKGKGWYWGPELSIMRLLATSIQISSCYSSPKAAVSWASTNTFALLLDNVWNASDLNTLHAQLVALAIWRTIIATSDSLNNYYVHAGAYYASLERAERLYLALTIPGLDIDAQSGILHARNDDAYVNALSKGWVPNVERLRLLPDDKLRHAAQVLLTKPSMEFVAAAARIVESRS